MKIPTLALAAAALVAVAPLTVTAQKPIDAGPYVPSPQSVVSDMLKLAEVGPEDFVIDLGSGDGRIVLTAAKLFGARGFGVEIKDELVRQSNEAAKAQGLADRVRFINADLFKTDISQASVLTMYLLPDTVNMLKEKLLAELKPGTRILSHDYPLAGWIPEKYVQMDLEDKVPISGVTTTLIYLYVVPAKVAGIWTAKMPPSVSREPVRLDLRQQLTRVSGYARVGGKDIPLDEPKLRGERLSFRLVSGGRIHDFTAALKGAAFEGVVRSGGISSPWSAAPVR
jgi:SAM-dependent methyltransferase